MTEFIIFISGLLVGSIIMFIGYSAIIQDKDDLIEDYMTIYNKILNSKNILSLRQIYIIQSLKELLKKQKKLIRKTHDGKFVKDANIRDWTLYGNYEALVYIEYKLEQFEKESQKIKDK